MKNALLIAALVVSSGVLYAQDSTPIQLSLTPDIALYPKTTLVRGFALDVWGENPQASINFGLVNGSTGDSAGFSWGIVNYADSYTGIQWGAINISLENFVGWQEGWVNVSQGSFKGLQSSWINVAQDMTGLQVGVVNYSERLNGLQLGFLNLAMNNPWFTECPDKLATGFPFVNWSF